MLYVLAVGNHSQIVSSIVERVVVDVIDDFAFGERAGSNALSDDSMRQR